MPPATKTRRHPLFEQRFETRGLRILGHDVLGLLFEAGHVLHEVSHRDRLAFPQRYLEVEILIHVRVEVDLALLDELHHRRPGEEF